MSAIPSTMLPLGTTAPIFSLLDVVSGETVSLDDFVSAKALLIVFTCNHCPYAIHAMPAILAISKEFGSAGLQIVAISTNDAEAYPADSPELMKQLATKDDYPFPYLYDETQEVAKRYTAACTPDIFLFDSNQKLVYRGQIDDTRPNSDFPATGENLRSAIKQLLAGKEISVEQKPSIGCSIKWKPGNEPE